VVDGPVPLHRYLVEKRGENRVREGIMLSQPFYPVEDGLEELPFGLVHLELGDFIDGVDGQ